MAKCTFGFSGWRFFLTTAGGGSFLVNGCRFQVSRGDLVAISPGTPHEVGHSPGWSNFWVHVQIEKDWYDLLRWPELAPGVRRIQLDDRLMLRIEREFSELESIQEDRSIRLRLLLVMNQFERILIYCDPANPGRRRWRNGIPQLQPAVEQLVTRYREAQTVGGLARLCGMSRSLFARLFREMTGMSPVAFLEQQRMNRAVHLLHEGDASVAAIAEAVGYESSFYFSRRFKRAYGESPLRYRQKARGRF